MKVDVRFRELASVEQWVGPQTSESLEAYVLFDIDAGDRGRAEALRSRVKLTAGGAYDEDQLEIELPGGYDGPMNYAGFRHCAEAYYRSLVGPGGRLVNRGPDQSSRLVQLKFKTAFDCSFEVED